LIESGLLQIHCRSSSQRCATARQQPAIDLTNNIQVLRPQVCATNDRDRSKCQYTNSQTNQLRRPTFTKRQSARELTQSFLRLTQLPSAPLERIGRYELALWRQFMQVLFALDEATRRRQATLRPRFTPYPPQW
jgi:hypothetical protein